MLEAMEGRGSASGSNSSGPEWTIAFLLRPESTIALLLLRPVHVVVIAAAPVT